MMKKAITAAFALLTVGGATQAQTKPWWQGATIYEIYPRSFQDTNGDGLGDLNGVTRRLDYLQSLGVDAIWLTPVYPSPQIDFGYDISDYRAIDPRFGTLADFDRLVAQAKRRRIRVIIDMVLNHTSDRHAWFEASRSSRTDPKRDWYVWRDGRAGGPPTNWNSIFGHSAWDLDAKTGQYYLHQFLPQQPDLNWRHPAVETAMFDTVRFWLDRGVDGFRLDAITTLFEDARFRDAAPEPGLNDFGDHNQSRAMTDDLPEVHGVMQRLRAAVDRYPGDRVLIGETYVANVAALGRWYGAPTAPELHLPMDLQLGFADHFDAPTLRARLIDAQTGLSGHTPLFVFDNHDQKRSWDRIGDGTHRPEIARMVAALLLATRGTALLYAGQELGMATTTPTRREDVRDPNGINGWPKDKGRDGERTPMQWDATSKAGFTTGTPWLPLQPDARHVNVAAESADAASLLNWYKRLIALRKSNPALSNGAMEVVPAGDEQLLAWVRRAPGAPTVVVALNVSPTPRVADLHALGARATALAASSAPNGTVALGQLALAPYGVFVGELR